MEKLKEFKNKHDHLFTKILKVSIFSLVMLAPMFAVLAKCLYTLNPNAKESYYGETINETQSLQINNKNNFRQNYRYDVYYKNSGDSTINRNQSRIYFTTLNYNGNEYEYGYFDIVKYGTSSLYFSLNGAEISSSSVITNQTILYFTYETKINTFDDIFFNFVDVYEISYNSYSYIDNVFYYSVEQIGNENIFSWTKNTGIYGAINTMTTGLGIDPTNNILAILLTYWTLITAVYVIIDIVLEIFTKLTHMI